MVRRGTGAEGQCALIRVCVDGTWGAWRGTVAGSEADAVGTFVGGCNPVCTPVFLFLRSVVAHLRLVARQRGSMLFPLELSDDV